MLVHPSGFLSSAAELCRRHAVHLIVDEVATGFGRTGTLFACEQERVSPDFLCLAKGISGGYLPLAATLATEEIYAAFLGKREDLRQFFHGHTYTANPLACAVGLESLALLRESSLANARAQVPNLASALDRIRQLRGVRGVRQCGLMAGIEIDPRAGRYMGADICVRARAHGVILRPLGDVVVWMPPLTLQVGDLELLERATAAAIDEVCG
jgi:adenosylmethionine-8-amino-7-oxononanoate aminotransferase